MYPLNDFYEKGTKIQNNRNLVDTNFNTLNRSIFKQSINLFNDMSEHDLCMLIRNNIDTISNDILHDDVEYVPLLKNRKFISCFIKAISYIPLDYNVKLACNKITYDYFTSENSETDVKKQFLNMSKIVNKEYINKLISIGLNEEIATNLALCRFSSSNEKTNSKRLNFAIYFRDPNIMTEQTIIWIYEKLYNRMSDLFQAIMFEVYTLQQQEDFGDNFMEVYGTVGLVILVILNNMTSENIRKVLVGYAAEWEYKGRPPVRFSFHCLSNDYSKINRVVEYLNSNGTLIP